MPVGRLVPSLTRRRTAGNALADLALGKIPVPPGECYARQRKGKIVWDQPSELVRDDATRDAPWAASVELGEAAPRPGVGM